jgi:hypothetical protein
MDREQVRETVNQLVESEHDQRQATTLLRNFQDTNEPPLAPGEFENLEAFLDFYGGQQDYKNRVQSLKTEHADAKQQYDQARMALSQALPTNVLLHYTYEGNREELKGQQYDIVNVSAPGRGQIRIMPRGPTQA